MSTLLLLRCNYCHLHFSFVTSQSGPPPFVPVPTKYPSPTRELGLELSAPKRSTHAPFPTVVIRHPPTGDSSPCRQNKRGWEAGYEQSYGLSVTRRVGVKSLKYLLTYLRSTVRVSYWTSSFLTELLTTQAPVSDRLSPIRLRVPPSSLPPPTVHSFLESVDRFPLHLGDFLKWLAPVYLKGRKTV